MVSFLDAVVAFPTAIFTTLLGVVAFYWLLALLPGSIPVVVGGTLLTLTSVSLAVPIAARILKPLRGLFVTHAAISNASLVGQHCKVLTQTAHRWCAHRSRSYVRTHAPQV